MDDLRKQLKKCLELADKLETPARKPRQPKKSMFIESSEEEEESSSVDEEESSSVESTDQSVDNRFY